MRRTDQTTNLQPTCYHQEIYCRPNGKEYTARPFKIKVAPGDTFVIKAPRGTKIAWLPFEEKANPFTSNNYNKTVSNTTGLAEFTLRSGADKGDVFEYTAEIPSCGSTSTGPSDRPSMEVGP